MKRKILFAIGAVAMLASCSSDNDTPTVNKEGSLRVNATIAEIQTRAHDASWDANDAIAIVNGTTIKQYTTTAGDGSFTAADGFQLSDAAESFYAFYPYNASGASVSFNVADNSSDNAPVAQTTVDFMYASAVSASRTNPTATFTFTHKMSKLSFMVKDPKGVLDNESDYSIKVTLSNVATSGSFNTATGTVTADAATGSLKFDATLNTASTVIVPSFLQQTHLKLM